MERDTITLLEAVKQIQPVPGLATTLLIGDKIVYLDTTKVEQDFYAASRKLAPIVSRKIGSKTISHTDWANYNFQTPDVKMNWPLEEDFLLQRMPGEPIIGGLAPEDRETEWQGIKMAEGYAMVERLVEWMITQYLTTGKLSIVGDGYTDEIDLVQTNHEVLAAAAQWDQATSDPLSDLARYRMTCITTGGAVPNICLMGTSAAGAFLSNAAVLAALDNRNLNIGQLAPEAMPDGTTRIGYLPALDMTIYCHGGQYEDANGTMTPYVAADRIAMFPSAARNSAYLCYGIIRDAVAKQWAKTKVYPRIVVDPVANTEFFEIISRPLPVYLDVNSFYWADVI